MSQIHTLSDIGEGKKLGDMPTNRYPSSRTELENQLVCANQDREIAIECGNRLANKCSILDKDNKLIQKDLNQSNKDKEKLSKQVYQLIDEIKRLRSELNILTSQITQSQISRDEYKARYDIQLKEIKSLQAMIKILEGKIASAQKDAFSIQENLSKTESENLSLKSKMVEFKQIEVELEQERGKLVSAQEDLSKKESEILSFKSKITEVEQELVSTVSELENLKSEDISVELTRPKPMIGGNDEKNIAKSDSQSEDVFASNNGVSAKAHISIISESSNSLRPYLARRKNIEDIEKIDDDDRVIPIPKVSDSCNEVTNATETSKDIMLDTYINSDPQISVGGIEAIPIVTSSLVSPLSAYMLLILIIAVIWFVVFRREWGIGRLKEPLFRRTEGTTLKGYKKK
ncbi:hypothetical protein Glove_938g6 [Diversispora epigaea]|uniref:Uncharacterized protein n=1 Tax=Diversispora epigaea TaxID=1348612 RepID=A0A397FY15_9GLOM|nr:hypothetical protein Glove_938g6 [Diversispora epigaea]